MKKKILHRFWTGKTVLVTGASSGLGQAVVEALAPYGIRFGLISRRLDKMQELAARLRNSGSQFWMAACDVRDREQVYRAVRNFHQVAGRLDVAWVNSGVGGDSSFRRWEWERVEAMLDTNLKGAIYTIRACLEIMIPQGCGTVVGIGSAASMRGLPGKGIYCLTKIGLGYFLDSLAAEIPQLQFTTIHPGYVQTPIIENSTDAFLIMAPEKAARIMITAVAKGRQEIIFPWQIRWIYGIVRALPTPVYRKLAHLAVSFKKSKKRSNSS